MRQSFNPKLTFAGWDIYYTTSHQNVRSKHSARFFSTEKPNAWTHISSPYRAPDVLLNPSLQEKMPGSFTILNPKYILNSLSSLALHYKAIGKKKSDRITTDRRNLIDLIVFKPERVAKHIVGVVAATELRIKDDDHFLTICSTLFDKVLPAVQDQQKRINHDIKQAESSILDTIKRHKNKGIIDEAIMGQYFSIYNTIKKNNSISENEAEEITTQILLADETRKIINEHVYNIVVDTVVEEINQQQVNPLEEFSNADRKQILVLTQNEASQRHTHFIGGGPASGKSTLAEKLLLDMKREENSTDTNSSHTNNLFLPSNSLSTDVSPLDNLAVIATDRYRKWVKYDQSQGQDESLGKDVVLQGLFTQDESRLMTEMSFKLIKAKIEETNVGPHVLMETVSPINEEINIGLLKNAKVRISFTSCDPQNAVEGNFARFQATGERLPPVSAVLGGQQLASNGAPKIANHYVRQNVLMLIHDTDLMRKQKDHNGLIAIFACRENKLIVRDLPGLLEFIKKSHINPVAPSKDKMYLSPNKVSTNNLVKECLEIFDDKEVIFVDPTIKNIDQTNAHQHIYATYNKDKGFTIVNNELFEKTIAENANLQKIIDCIKKHLVKEEPVERRIARP